MSEIEAVAKGSTEGAERDWVFARRFVVRRMIERGDATAADRIPEIPEYGALADENERLRAVLEDLESAVRMGGLAGSPHTLAFVWAQNKDAILDGTTTWEAQWGPHRRGDFGSRSERP